MQSGRYTPTREAAGASAAPVPADLETFRTPLRVFAARRLRDGSAAEDVSQEALRLGVEAINAGRIKSSEALPGFLFKTAVHLCMHRSRSAGREKRALERFAFPSREASAEDPLKALISSEQQSRVQQALGELEAAERQLLEMTYRDELSSEAIGRQLGLTPGAVRVRRYRALRRLAERLGVTNSTDREISE